MLYIYAIFSLPLTNHLQHVLGCVGRWRRRPIDFFVINIINHLFIIINYYSLIYEMINLHKFIQSILLIVINYVKLSLFINLWIIINIHKCLIIKGWNPSMNDDILSSHDKVIRRTTVGFEDLTNSRTVRDRGSAVKIWKAKEVWEWSHHEDMMQSFIQWIKINDAGVSAPRLPKTCCRWLVRGSEKIAYIYSIYICFLLPLP